MRSRLWRGGIALVALACASSAFVATPAPAAKGRPLRVDGSRALLHALPRSLPRAPSSSTAPVALPSWHGSSTHTGTSYGYTLRGTEPAAGSHTTRLRINLPPLRLT